MYLPLFYFIGPYHLIGFGLFASLFLPKIIIGILSIVLLIYPAIRQLLRHFNWIPIPYSQHIIPTTFTGRCEGDFVVFLIGSRCNTAYPLTKSYTSLRKAFMSMQAELESDPSIGYMGGDLYVGANDRKSTTMFVQYWRNYESLQKWSHKRMSLHLKKMSEYTSKNQIDTPDGIWHETYKVRDGEYETIYHNMPPIGLALATETYPETKLRNGAGRMNRKNREKQIGAMAFDDSAKG